jgi:hypothetical protein
MTIESKVPTGDAERQSTPPPVQGLIGLGGQKARALSMHQGRTSRPAPAASQKGSDSVLRIAQTGSATAQPLSKIRASPATVAHIARRAPAT